MSKLSEHKYNEAYQKGIEKGRELAKIEHIHSNCDEAYQDGYEQGYRDGQDKGESDGRFFERAELQKAFEHLHGSEYSWQEVCDWADKIKENRHD